MNVLNIETSTNCYPIYIDEKIRYQTSLYHAENYSKILIVTDECVADLYLRDVKKALRGHPHVYQMVIQQGEQSKNVDNFYQLHTAAIEYSLDRHSLIIALGGGVVGDLAGFVAATFMRGIDYIQVPTTILAHDSSVGGKVAINHRLGKNLIGSFYPPTAVIYDIQTLQTLPEREIRSGYAELIKEALIADQSLFEDIIQTDLSDVKSETLLKHILNGIKIKAHYVQVDEKENGLRAFLNFGHTLGHALESEIGYGTITHGEAVAIGLLFALEVSNNFYSVSLPIEKLQNWLQANNFPLLPKNMSVDNLVRRMKSDKKSIQNHVQMVLLKKLGDPVKVKVTDDDLRNYLKSFITKYT